MKYERVKRNAMSKEMSDHLTAFTSAWDGATYDFFDSFKKEVETRLRNAGYESAHIQTFINVYSRLAKSELFNIRQDLAKKIERSIFV